MGEKHQNQGLDDLIIYIATRKEDYVVQNGELFLNLDSKQEKRKLCKDLEVFNGEIYAVRSVSSADHQKKRRVWTHNVVNLTNNEVLLPDSNIRNLFIHEDKLLGRKSRKIYDVFSGEEIIDIPSTAENLGHFNGSISCVSVPNTYLKSIGVDIETSEGNSLVFPDGNLIKVLVENSEKKIVKKVESGKIITDLAFKNKILFYRKEDFRDPSWALEMFPTDPLYVVDSDEPIGKINKLGKSHDDRLVYAEAIGKGEFGSAITGMYFVRVENKGVTKIELPKIPVGYEERTVCDSLERYGEKDFSFGPRTVQVPIPAITYHDIQAFCSISKEIMDKLNLQKVE